MADQQVVEQVASFTERKVISLEVVRVQGSTNQVYGTNQILLHYSILEDNMHIYYIILYRDIDIHTYIHVQIYTCE